MPRTATAKNKTTTSKLSAKQYVQISQGSLYVAITLCLILMPQYLFSRDQGGVSNYGLYAQTVVFYSLGFLIAAACLLRAATILHRTHRQHLFANALRLLAGLYVLNLLTTYPYKLNHDLTSLHIWAAVLLLSAEMILAVWLVATLAAERRSSLLLLLQFIGFLLLALTFKGNIHLLFVGQVWTGLAFGLLLIRVCERVTGSQKSKH